MEPLILGTGCDAPIMRGEALDITFQYLNEDGSPIDLSTSTVVVASSSPAILKDAGQVSILDAAAGTVRLFLGAPDAGKLRPGTGNRFRLCAAFGSQGNDLSPEIFLQVTP